MYRSLSISLPELEQLDYALLRVDGAPGNDPVGNKAEPAAPSRKWIEVPTQVPDIDPNTALFIIQHPRGDPLQLALETNAIVAVNANNTRVSYRTNTLLGSSGSPCFNSNWELVALHHSGDPNFDPAHKPVYNEGIPIITIVKSFGAAWSQRNTRRTEAVALFLIQSVDMKYVFFCQCDHSK